MVFILVNILDERISKMKKEMWTLSIKSWLYVVVFLSACNGQQRSKLSNQKVDNSNGTNSKIQIPPRVDSVLEFNSMITAIMQDSKGNIWFGSHCDGVCKYEAIHTENTIKKRFTYYTVDQGLPNFSTHPLYNRQVPQGNSIRYLREDIDGNIWLGTGDGISKFDGEEFTTIFAEKESQLITESFDPARDDWDTEYDHLWFAAFGKNGVYRYDGKRLKHLTFPTTEASEKLSFSPFSVFSIYKDRNKHIWFGTESGGFFRYDGKTFTCVNEKEEKGIVRSFFQDNDGVVWIGNVLQGLYCYYHNAFKKEEEYLTNFTKISGHYNLTQTRADDSLDESLLLDGIQSIEQDENGELWFGSYSSGLWRYDGESFIHYTEDTGLPSNTVKTIFKDNTGKLLFGMGEDKGRIYFFDGKTFQRF